MATPTFWESRDARNRALTCVAIAAVYLAACACPAMDVLYSDAGPSPEKPEAWPGYAVLLFGWMYGPVPWSANLILLAGGVCFLRGRNRTAAVLGVAAAAVGLTTWAVVPSAELLGVGVGYYVWQTSLFLLALAAIAFDRRAAARERGSPAAAT